MVKTALIQEPYQLSMGLTLVFNGASGATNLAGRTTTGGSGSGMTVALTAAGGVVTGVTIETLGNGLYRRGDLITVSTAQAGTSTTVTFRLGQASTRDGALAVASVATRAYIAAVEAADGQQLESGVLQALVAFANYRIPLGGVCSCYMGPRTLAGKLVPMVGPAPTGVNLVAGDVCRLGIKGNGINKTINMNYTNGAYGTQNSRSIGTWVAERDTGFYAAYFGNVSPSGRCFLRSSDEVTRKYQFAVNGFVANLVSAGYPLGLVLLSRNSSATAQVWAGNSEETFSAASIAPDSFAMYALSALGSGSFSNARISLFSDSAYTDPAVFDSFTSALFANVAALPAAFSIS
jgi:hypothetical protein